MSLECEYRWIYIIFFFYYWPYSIKRQFGCNDFLGVSSVSKLIIYIHLPFSQWSYWFLRLFVFNNSVGVSAVSEFFVFTQIYRFPNGHNDISAQLILMFIFRSSVCQKFCIYTYLIFINGHNDQRLYGSNVFFGIFAIQKILFTHMYRLPKGFKQGEKEKEKDRVIKRMRKVTK